MTEYSSKSLQFENGDQMPVLGLGTWKSKPQEVYRAVKEAVRLGYRHIDCAFIYENEAEIGLALQECFEEGLVKREDLWVTSKLWNDSHGAADVEGALKKTLADLRLDYLDLYLVHWPVAMQKGVLFPRTAADMISLDDLPVLETWGAMEATVDAGLCRHIGVSNFSVAKLEPLLRSARLKPEVNQVELHPFLGQPGVLEFCSANHVHLTAYSPLGSPDRAAGLKGEDEPSLLQNEVVTAIASQHGVSPAQVLISWAIDRGTSVIPKSVNPGRMAQNLAAVEISLSDDDKQQLSSLEQHRRYVTGAFWALEGGPYTVANLWDE